MDVVVFQPMKHYHRQAVDLVVREGYVYFSTLDFLGLIQSVRIQALKRENVISAFRKTGIVPYNPNIVLSVIEERAARQASPFTPPRPTNSSPFGTPLTIRKLERVANRLLAATQSLSEDYQHLNKGLERFTRGTLVQSTELIQTRCDLGRTELAQQVRKQRRAAKNTQLQTAGVLTVQDGR